MDYRIKKTLWILLAALIIFPVVILLTGDLSSIGKGLLHGLLTLVFLVMVFSVWSSLRPITWKKVGLTILWAVVFYFGLPIAIQLVSGFPIVLKGIAHLLVIILFIAAFLWIWYDERKAPHYRG
ncbi:Uncharacterised protein [Alloiococcus otitis]|uniref:Uncharacterized protein n=1 Tax=Alloiococcus otitis ATCC 51267 TaxID=883081 RepID=K9EUX8_9LACT|nr:hypothetical protein [Alloiococcus otitis]EKU93005.1 hypothetical protein HMPREF9698_01311 [Alloiococcus otitis ATCC 51267]SUU80867.1 Uncharacterised protein [Alloiococcus otitis]